MFSFGEQLYRLTSRDEETLLVDPFVRVIPVLVAANSTANLDVPVPKDRLIYVKSVTWLGFGPAGAGAAWQEWQVNLNLFNGDPTPMKVAGVVGNTPLQFLQTDGTIVAQPANGICQQTQQVDFMFPAGYSLLRLTASRIAGTITEECRFYIRGYFLPPGRIGRIS